MLVSVFGKRGTGKTFLIKRTLEYIQGPIVVFDFLGNFHDLKGKHTTSVKEAVLWLMEWNTKSEENVLILSPPNVNAAVDVMCRASWEKGNCTLVIDEVDMVDYNKATEFDYLIRYGRNRGVHLLVACRRPFEISRNITAGANAIYIFQTQEPRDIEYYSKSILGKDALRLQSLAKYHGIVIDYDRERTGIFQVNDKGDLFFIENITKSSLK